jgi:mono/diheme cytochrome c family protein
MKFNTASSLLVAAVLAIAPAMSIAQDAPTLYKSKCQMCHGDAGQGKMGPKLVGTAKTPAEIVALLTKGGAAKAPHINAISGLTADQATSLATFIKAMK